MISDFPSIFQLGSFGCFPSVFCLYYIGYVPVLFRPPFIYVLIKFRQIYSSYALFINGCLGFEGLGLMVWPRGLCVVGCTVLCLVDFARVTVW